MHEEKYGSRDLAYSAWHRRNSISRYPIVGMRNAGLLGMIDIDAVYYVEYRDVDRMPIAIVETAIDVGQKYKPATVTTNIARYWRNGNNTLSAYCLLYKLADNQNPEYPMAKDIEYFRVRRLWPSPIDKDWKKIAPKAWARHLCELRNLKERAQHDS